MKNFFKGVVKKFFDYNCLQLASQISFFGLLSIIPLLMIGVFITAQLLGHAAPVYNQLVSRMLDVLPYGQKPILENLQSVMSARLSFGVWGSSILLLLSLLLFSALEQALNTIFASEKKRNFFQSRLLGIGFILIVALFFSLPTLAELTEKSLTGFGFHFPLGALLRSKFFFLVATYGAFVTIVSIVPNKNVPMRHALLGGFIFSVGVSLAKRWFHWYLYHAFSVYNVIYGSLTALVLLVVWVYYVSLILLIASLCVAQLSVRSGEHQRPVA